MRLLFVVSNLEESEVLAKIKSKKHVVSINAKWYRSGKHEGEGGSQDNKHHESVSEAINYHVESPGLEPSWPSVPVYNAVRRVLLWLASIQGDVCKRVIVAVLESWREDGAVNKKPEVVEEEWHDSYELSTIFEDHELLVDLVHALRASQLKLARLHASCVLYTPQIGVVVDEGSQVVS